MVINYLSPKCCNIYPLNKDGDNGPNLPEGGTQPWLHAVGTQEEEGDHALSLLLVTSLLLPLPVPMESQWTWVCTMRGVDGEGGIRAHHPLEQF